MQNQSLKFSTFLSFIQYSIMNVNTGKQDKKCYTNKQNELLPFSHPAYILRP